MSHKLMLLSAASLFLLTPLAPISGVENANVQSPMIEQGQVAPQMTDDNLKNTIVGSFSSDPEIANINDDLDVSVDEGVVTLSGTVNSEALRSKIEGKVKSIAGIKQVVNNIEVDINQK